MSLDLDDLVFVAVRNSETPAIHTLWCLNSENRDVSGAASDLKPQFAISRKPTRAPREFLGRAYGEQIQGSETVTLIPEPVFFRDEDVNNIGLHWLPIASVDIDPSDASYENQDDLVPDVDVNIVSELELNDADYAWCAVVRVNESAAFNTTGSSTNTSGTPEKLANETVTLISCFRQSFQPQSSEREAAIIGQARNSLGQQDDYILISPAKRINERLEIGWSILTLIPELNTSNPLKIAKKLRIEFQSDYYSLSVLNLWRRGPSLVLRILHRNSDEFNPMKLAKADTVENTLCKLLIYGRVNILSIREVIANYHSSSPLIRIRSVDQRPEAARRGLPPIAIWPELWKTLFKYFSDFNSKLAENSLPVISKVFEQRQSKLSSDFGYHIQNSATKSSFSQEKIQSEIHLLAVPSILSELIIDAVEVDKMQRLETILIWLIEQTLLDYRDQYRALTLGPLPMGIWDQVSLSGHGERNDWPFEQYQVDGPRVQPGQRKEIKAGNRFTMGPAGLHVAANYGSDAKLGITAYDDVFALMSAAFGRPGEGAHQTKFYDTPQEPLEDNDTRFAFDLPWLAKRDPFFKVKPRLRLNQKDRIVTDPVLKQNEARAATTWQKRLINEEVGGRTPQDPLFWAVTSLAPPDEATLKSLAKPEFQTAPALYDDFLKSGDFEFDLWEQGWPFEIGAMEKKLTNKLREESWKEPTILNELVKAYASHELSDPQIWPQKTELRSEMRALLRATLDPKTQPLFNEVLSKSKASFTEILEKLNSFHADALDDARSLTPLSWLAPKWISGQERSALDNINNQLGKIEKDLVNSGSVPDETFKIRFNTGVERAAGINDYVYAWLLQARLAKLGEEIKSADRYSAYLFLAREDGIEFGKKSAERAYNQLVQTSPDNTSLEPEPICKLVAILLTVAAGGTGDIRTLAQAYAEAKESATADVVEFWKSPIRAEGV